MVLIGVQSLLRYPNWGFRLPNATYAAVGDEVVAVNGTPTAGLGLTDVTALKAGTGDGPLTLKLEREFATSDAAAAAAGDVGAGAGDGDGAAAAVGEPSVGEVPNAVATLAPKAQKKQDRKLYDELSARTPPCPIIIIRS